MSVYYCIPSARPAAKAQRCVDAWRDMGYKVALWRDSEDAIDCDLMLVGEYPGYAMAVNALAAEVLKDHGVQWIVAGGDDTLPDQNLRADQIEVQLTEHFGGTFGVCQPTGDRFAQGSIDRIAGSPWLGREWCERANGGQGPFWPQFVHMYGDECLQRTAKLLGVFLQRQDLTHLHMHFMRQSADINSPAMKAPPPPHLVQWNSQKHWDEMQTIFRRLENQDFAPCMPLPVAVHA